MMGTYEPIAYVDGYNGAMLCPEHGETYHDETVAEYGTDNECAPTPVMEWDEPLDPLQSCDHGHAFCGNCGAGEGWLDVTRRRFSTNYRCGNCGAEERFMLDGRRFARWGGGTGTWCELDA